MSIPNRISFIMLLCLLVVAHGNSVIPELTVPVMPLSSILVSILWYHEYGGSSDSAYAAAG